MIFDAKNWYFPNLNIQYVEHDMGNTVFMVVARYKETTTDEEGTYALFVSGPTVDNVRESMKNREIEPGFVCTEVVEVKALSDCLDTLDAAISGFQILM